MIKHASSHGFAVFMCTIISAIYIEVIKQFLPQLLRRIDHLSSIIIQKLSLSLTPDTITIVVVASVLAMIWGAFFKMYHSK